MVTGLVRRLAGAVVGVLLAGVSLVAAVPAHAEEPLTFGRQIVRYDVTVELARDGVAEVSIDMDFDFGNDPGHGPYITLPTRVRYDDERDRVYRVSDVRASSATGAPARVHLDRSPSSVAIRVGSEHRGNISGVQQYTISYRLEGMVNGAAGEGTYDEFYWNVIGSGWEIPISNASVTIQGPGPISEVRCFAGPRGSTESCTSEQFEAATAHFTEDVLPTGRLFSVLVGWPAGTFRDVDPILERRRRASDPVDPVSPGGLAALVILLLGVGTAVTRVRTRGRDEAYLGLTPGVTPAPGAFAKVGPRDTRTPVAVQFTPPADVRPGVLGTLLDEVADPHDVTATLVDLAVRGYLRIEEVPRKNPAKPAKNWRLVRLRDLDPTLAPFELTLLRGIFTGRDEVTLSQLKTTFASTMAQVQGDLYTEVTGRGWFRTDPKAVRARWTGVGSLLAVVGFGASMFAFAADGFRGSVLIPLAVLVVGITVLVCAKHAPARTAEGTAVLAQALGFKQYLATAEANQLRFEEGEDIFSRYLPYAIAFGEATRWAKVFEDLAAQGASVPEPSWYVGSGALHGALWASGGSFSNAISSFSSTATTSFSAPTPGSSGGSGFSSGGGFSGGGGGGGGGGGW